MSGCAIRTYRPRFAQAGWAQRGGEMLRDAQDQVIGRTQWLPNEPWYAAIPERLDRAATIKAVKKAIAGKKLGGKEERVLGYVLDAFESERAEGQLSPEEREVQSALRPGEEAEREAREEREAIMAEGERALDALSDEDIDTLVEWTPFDLQARLRKHEDIKRFFDGETSEGGRGAEQDSPGEARAGAAPGEEARVDGERPLLQGYTAADLAEREQARLDAERKEAEATAAALRKRQADRDREGFVLSGSDKKADEREARGQRARYLRDAYRDLGDWGLPIASYNDGVSGMVRVRRHFGGDLEHILLSYHGRAFGFSSRNFYAEFLAARPILADLPRYFPERIQFHPPWKRNVSF